MRKNKKEKNVEKQVKYLFVILILLISISFALEYLLDKKISKEKELQRQQTIYTQIKEKFNIYVKTNKNIDIYKLEKDKYTKAGTISKDTELSLEKKEIKNYKDTYFKLANIDYYVNYKAVDKID
ncbi:MAG TPA: hypothetical protein PLV83_05210, partial [Bacilli bacterium]|nr:hypothetical protein [Bacilli bacterium]